jgi:hypothetical protein
MPAIFAGGAAAILAIWVIARGMKDIRDRDPSDGEPAPDPGTGGWDQWEWRTINTIGTKDNNDFDIQELFYHYTKAGWKAKSGSHRYRPVIINNATGDINSFLGINDGTDNRTKASARQALQSRFDSWGGTGPLDPTPNGSDAPPVDPSPQDPLSGGGGAGVPFIGSGGSSSPSVSTSAVGTNSLGGW